MLATVEVRKMLPDGSQWGHWSGFRLPVSANCPTVWTPLGTSMHWLPGTWHLDKHEISFCWPGRWYVISAFYDPAGSFAGCYCDIVTPNPRVTDDAPEIRYTDLYIDVVVRPDRTVLTKDEEVFARAMQVIPSLKPIRARAFAELDELAAHAHAWSGPFAPIHDHLSRTDWHMLDPKSPDFAAACASEWQPPF
jgi:hypothetical protein